MIDIAAALAGRVDVALSWAIYGLFHSLLAADFFKAQVARRWPSWHAHYRLVYNGLAILLLLPVGWLVLGRPGPLLWQPGPALRLVLDGLAAAALAALLIAGPRYDLRDFLGLADRRARPPRLHLSAWHCYVRHPWYSVGLVAVWTRQLTEAWLLSALCITVYFVVGSWFEERKLAAQFGEPYRRYMTRVPGLLPWRGRALSRHEARTLEQAAGS